MNEHFCLTEALKLVIDILKGQSVFALTMISACTNV
jgi:hypothetical protein